MLINTTRAQCRIFPSYVHIKSKVGNSDIEQVIHVRRWSVDGWMDGCAAVEYDAMVELFLPKRMLERVDREEVSLSRWLLEWVTFGKRRLKISKPPAYFGTSSSSHRFILSASFKPFSSNTSHLSLSLTLCYVNRKISNP